MRFLSPRLVLWASLALTLIPMEASARLIDFLKQQEGFRPELYCDAGGHCTIGYGHLVHLGKVGDDPQAEAPFTYGISPHTAEILLYTDLKRAEWTIEKFVTAPLTQGQYDALVSLIFNIGAGAFEESTLLRELNDRHYDAVPPLWVKWNHVNKVPNTGLTKRRLAELAMWNEGSADARA